MNNKAKGRKNEESPGQNPRWEIKTKQKLTYSILNLQPSISISLKQTKNSSKGGKGTASLSSCAQVYLSRTANIALSSSPHSASSPCFPTISLTNTLMFMVADRQTNINIRSLGRCASQCSAQKTDCSNAE